MLLSMTADQWLRFWDLQDMQTPKPPIYKMHANHIAPSINREFQDENQMAQEKGKPVPYVVAQDQLTGVAVTMENDRFVTTDTSGRIQMYNIREMDFRNMTKEEIEAKISNPWFINAHR